MENFKVRTYNSEKETPENALFILSRGRNAGKPLFEPCANCFILYCKDQNQLENLYWTFFTLWKNGFFHPYLCGSVIEMLRLFELKENHSTMDHSKPFQDAAERQNPFRHQSRF